MHAEAGGGDSFFARLGRASLLLSVVCLMAACASSPRIQYTEEDQATATVLSASYRTWADSSLEEFQRAEFNLPEFVDGGRASYLALSGGGANGAFGAGVLGGWTAAGTRPEFAAVSGISTGALIAPLAFLGSEYDAELAELYTGGIAKGLGQRRPLLAALFGSPLVDPQPLRQIVAFFVDEELLSAIAEEHRRGRRLYVVTTNLDAQRPVVWDMGAIAASGDPRAVTLFQEVLMASAAVPAVFPPIRIAAQSGERTFEEMHADGGIATQVFTLPEAILVSSVAELDAPTDLYVIMNLNLDPQFDVVEDHTFSLIERSLSTLLKTHARSELNATYAFAQRTGIGFHLASVDLPTPEDLDTFEFDTEHMRELYRSGYERALEGTLWEDEPPAARSGPAQQAREWRQAVN